MAEEVQDSGNYVDEERAISWISSSLLLPASTSGSKLLHSGGENASGKGFVERAKCKGPIQDPSEFRCEVHWMVASEGKQVTVSCSCQVWGGQCYVCVMYHAFCLLRLSRSLWSSGFMVQGLWFSWVCEDVTDLCKGQGLCFSYVFEVVTNFCEAQGFMVLKGMWGCHEPLQSPGFMVLVGMGCCYKSLQYSGFMVLIGMRTTIYLTQPINVEITMLAPVSLCLVPQIGSETFTEDWFFFFIRVRIFFAADKIVLDDGMESEGGGVQKTICERTCKTTEIWQPPWLGRDPSTWALEWRKDWCRDVRNEEAVSSRGPSVQVHVQEQIA